jgi:translation initiation factor 2 alpha subunit (eIF-2alpha)
MLKLLAGKLNLNPEDTKNISAEIEEKFGNVFDAFQMSLTPQGYDLLLRKGIKEDLVQAIKNIAEEQLEIKEAVIKKIVELKSYEPDGVNDIKNILSEAKKEFELEIKYVSAPKYSLSVKTKNAKAGERKIKEASDIIIKKIEESGGEGKVE